MADVDVDVAIVGAGGAGLSLVCALDRALARSGRPAPSIALLDPVHRREADRTWCWWSAEPEDEPLEPLLHRTWSRLELIDRAGAVQQHDLGPIRYAMLRSTDFYAEADAAFARLATAGRAVRIRASVDRVVEAGNLVANGAGGSVLIHAGDSVVRARWVFDSRPAAPRRPGAVALLQHFRGWSVRFEAPVLDPGLATLMDFRLPQPRGGVAFGYCLPLSERRALVEYTEFSRRPLASEQYDAALRGYLRRRWDVEPGAGASIEAVEDGVIPMTDAPFARQVGARVFRIGTAGGATRPSTGYTFATMQRQAAAIAEALLAGRPPVPPKPYPARHLWLDAVLLRALDSGYVQGADLFCGLFAANPPGRVVRFLDGRSGRLEELALMRSAPALPMMRATIADAVARLRRAAVTGRRRPRP